MSGTRPDSLPSHLQLVERIGSGGSSTVWRARDRRAGCDVAVKVIDLGAGRGAGRGDGGGAAERAERFEQEARALARLRGSPGVLTVHGLGVGDDGRAWIVTDLLAGGSLADRLAGGLVGGLAGGPGRAAMVLPPDEVVRVGEVLAAALGSAHAVGVVHGDVTPANVLFDSSGAPLLADFGVSVVQPQRMPAGPGGGHGGGRGGGPITPAFAAPERRDRVSAGGASGATAASDVYGLGATLWAAASGRAPTIAGSVASPELPRGLDAVLVRCCDADPSRRPDAIGAGRLLSAERRRRARATRGGPRR